MLNWGVYPVVTKPYNSTDEIVNDGKIKALEFSSLKENDIILITGGFPNNTEVKTTNFMKIEKI
jgi:pyruvate kinase